MRTEGESVPYWASFFLFSCVSFFFFFFFFFFFHFQQAERPSPVHYASVTGGLHALHRRVAQVLKASPQQSWPTTSRDDGYNRRVVVRAREPLSHFLANFDGFSSWSWWFWNPHVILNKMTPSLPSFVAKKIGMFSHANKNLNLDPSQTKPYFEVTIPNLY